jgi:hypothetical protein
MAEAVMAEKFNGLGRFLNFARIIAPICLTPKFVGPKISARPNTRQFRRISDE